MDICNLRDRISNVMVILTFLSCCFYVRYYYTKIFSKIREFKNVKICASFFFKIFPKKLKKKKKEKNGNANITWRRSSNKIYRSYRQVQEYSIFFFYEFLGILSFISRVFYFNRID